MGIMLLIVEFKEHREVAKPLDNSTKTCNIILYTYAYMIIIMIKHH